MSEERQAWCLSYRCDCGHNHVHIVPEVGQVPLAVPCMVCGVVWAVERQGERTIGLRRGGKPTRAPWSPLPPAPAAEQGGEAVDA